MSDEPSGELAFLRTELDQQLHRYTKRRKRDKRKAFALRLSTVLLSATISVLLGLRNFDGYTDLFANIALGLGALITVLAAADAFFSHRELWILRTQTVRDLENISRDLRYCMSKDRSPEERKQDVERIYGELNRAIERDSRNWDRLRAPSGADPKE
ncbi:DUF4231 domain-containing protein [Amycolatopsis sp. Hca4]|uniref:DUF4231 domain-containing protein n=1 Tax=Amycolatopsis sp. Hca4 TaxID=2742131 RepID=UPI001592048B|nr:DUF4231 domain-containing protein [Amycolatopsis sp. Hca4]QKV75213.1 DUF4231 domain-containing protein [Amycolatopsis sp. Hca4]